MDSSLAFPADGTVPEMESTYISSPSLGRTKAMLPNFKQLPGAEYPGGSCLYFCYWFCFWCFFGFFSVDQCVQKAEWESRQQGNMYKTGSLVK